MASLMLTACSVDKYIGEGERLLYENQYIVSTTDGHTAPPEVNEALKEMRSYALQSPNVRPFGIKPLRLKMWVYTMADPNKNSWWHNYLRRQGEAPVIYDPNAAILTARQLGGLIESKGCFNSTVAFDTLHLKKRDVAVRYHITATPRRTIDDITYTAESDEVAKLLMQWKTNSLLHTGHYYDQNDLVAERDRIAERMSNNGFYTSSKGLINYILDTTYSDTLIGLELHIQNPVMTDANRQPQRVPLQRYRIGHITIDSNSVKQSTLRNVIRLREGQLYRTAIINDTYNALQGLRNFKYINIDFQESALSEDTARVVDAHIRLLNNTRHKISASLELSNASPFGMQQSGNFITNGNFGLETILGYQNRNLFGGAEQLKVEGSLLIELPKLMLRNGAAEFHETFSAFEGGIDASLDMPQFLMPFAQRISWQHTRPHTLISLGANYQYRTYFERILWNTSFGYAWSYRRRVQHQLRPVELTYVNFLNLDPTFMLRLQGVNDLRLKYQYSDHFVMDARYNYVYSNQTYGSRTNFSYLNASVETAGNLLKGFSMAFGGPQDSSNVYQVLGVPYSQYAKLNIDAKHYAYHGSRCTFVTRMLLGIGIPYGNSLSLPYEKSFFGGGPTTMRAWQLRHLGPGGYQHASNDILERVGDLTLVLNIEERFPIASIFEGAVFADIGNVWLMHASDEYPQGNLQASRLLKEMAVGVGLGLRCNISILTIRADFAIPLYDPGYTTAWRPSQWRLNQIVTNIGIDYPF